MKLTPCKIHGWPEPVMLPESQRILTQVQTLASKKTGKTLVKPVIRWDDQCKNGHNSFSVTATLYEQDKFDQTWRDVGGGCCHDEIAKSHPEIAHLIKWHLVSSDGPMHYLANTIYHALEHGPDHAWIDFEDLELPVPIKKQCMLYCELKKAEAICDKDKRYSMRIDAETAKEKNLDFARSSACWPEATDEQLMLPPKKLTKLLIDRLPALMDQFYKDITEFGFTY